MISDLNVQYINTGNDVSVLLKLEEYMQLLKDIENLAAAERRKEPAIDTFLKKWKGSLKGVEPDKAKHNYLQEKYQ